MKASNSECAEDERALCTTDPSEQAQRIKRLKQHKTVRYAWTAFGVVASALIQAFAIQAFVNPAGLLSSGFTGLAILVDRITQLAGISFPTFVGMIVFNIPVAIVCWRSISHRFVVFSMCQVVLAAVFVRVLSFPSFFSDTMLDVLFGGVVYGFSMALVLRAGASTAGTDFISLMVSTKTGKSAWGLIFVGNCCMLLVFGALFGWTQAAYSILFQFISTKTIETFYHRFDRLTLQITTAHPKMVLAAYNESYRHGSSCVEVTGGHGGQRFWMITTVVSSYEVEDVVFLVREWDDKAIINTLHTVDFYGGFYQKPIE